MAIVRELLTVVRELLTVVRELLTVRREFLAVGRGLLTVGREVPEGFRCREMAVRGGANEPESGFYKEMSKKSSLR